MNAHEAREIASFIVAVFGLPIAIGIFIHEQRRERNHDEEEVHMLLPSLPGRALP